MHKFILQFPLQWIYRWLFLSFFLPPKWQTIGLITVSLFILYRSISEKISFTKKELLLAFILGSGYLLYLVYLPFTDPQHRSIMYSFLERKISLFLFPFIFLSFSKLKPPDFMPSLQWFTISNAITCVLANMMALVHFMFFDQEGVINHVAYRTYFEELTNIHPSYFGIYCCFSFCCLILYPKYVASGNKYLTYCLIGILLISLLLLSPKTAILSLLAASGFLAYSSMKKSFLQKMQWISLLIAVLLIAYYGIPFLHQRIDEAMAFLNSPNNNLKNNSVGIRQLILQANLSLLKKHWLWGMGPIKLQQGLTFSLYMISNFIGEPLGTYNTHNEYLNQWLSFGLAGIGNLLFILGLHTRKAYTYKDRLYMSFLIIMGIAFLTENILSRQQGIVFFALFSSLFYFRPFIARRDLLA